MEIECCIKRKGLVRRGVKHYKFGYQTPPHVVANKLIIGFSFQSQIPGNVEIPFEIVYIAFSVQGLVIGGCTGWTTYLRIFFRKRCRLDLEIRFIELSTQFPWNCFLAFFQREVCLYKFSSMLWQGNESCWSIYEMQTMIKCKALNRNEIVCIQNQFVRRGKTVCVIIAGRPISKNSFQ